MTTWPINRDMWLLDRVSGLTELGYLLMMNLFFKKMNDFIRIQTVAVAKTSAHKFKDAIHPQIGRHRGMMRIEFAFTEILKALHVLHEEPGDGVMVLVIGIETFKAHIRSKGFCFDCNALLVGL